MISNAVKNSFKRIENKFDDKMDYFERKLEEMNKERVSEQKVWESNTFENIDSKMKEFENVMNFNLGEIDIKINGFDEALEKNSVGIKMKWKDLI